MNALFSRFGYMRLAALALTLLPLLVLPALGVFWLLQSQWKWYWLLALLGCGVIGYGLHWLDARRALKSLDAITKASPDWPSGSAGAWERVTALAERIDPDDWPLDNTGKLDRKSTRLNSSHVAISYS